MKLRGIALSMPVCSDATHDCIQCCESWIKHCSPNSGESDMSDAGNMCWEDKVQHGLILSCSIATCHGQRMYSDLPRAHGRLVDRLIGGAAVRL